MVLGAVQVCLKGILEGSFILFLLIAFGFPFAWKGEIPDIHVILSIISTFVLGFITSFTDSSEVSLLIFPISSVFHTILKITQI